MTRGGGRFPQPLGSAAPPPRGDRPAGTDTPTGRLPLGGAASSERGSPEEERHPLGRTPAPAGSARRVQPRPGGRRLLCPAGLQGGTRGGHGRAGGREAPASRDAHDGRPGPDSAVRPQAPPALPPPRRHGAPGAGCDWLGTGRRPASLANERGPRRRRANGQLRFSLRARGRLSLLKARRGGGEGSEVRAAPPEVEAGAALPPILSQPAACTSVLFPRGPVFLGPPRAALPW